jgi:hypothetical protein
MRFARYLIALIVAAAPAIVEAQGVLIAPHGIFMDHRTRTGSLELYNPGDQPAEVSISTLFGYPVTDSIGDRTLRTIEAPDSTQASAAGWIEAYPRRLILRPMERQRVRLFARPPGALPDGEYWTRLVVSAKRGGLPVTGVADTSAVQVGLTLEIRTVIAVLYRKGPVRTGVTVSNVRAQLVGDSLVVRARLTRQGNAAYLGMARGRLVDNGGRQVATFASQLGVYYTLEPRFAAAVGSLSPGRYTLHLEVSTDRDDLAREGLLRASPVRDSTVVTIARQRAP